MAAFLIKTSALVSSSDSTGSLFSLVLLARLRPLGIAALYVIATGFTQAIFPGGGGGGGGGGASGGYSFSLVIPPPLQAIFQLLITTFFMLYMFVIYADRTRKAPQA